jgi:hypothetical protein
VRAAEATPPVPTPPVALSRLHEHLHSVRASLTQVSSQANWQQPGAALHTAVAQLEQSASRAAP